MGNFKQYIYHHEGHEEEMSNYSVFPSWSSCPSWWNNYDRIQLELFR